MIDTDKLRQQFPFLPDLMRLRQEFPFLQDLGPADVTEFLKHTRILRLNPGDIFLQQGSMKSQVYFVLKGLIRSYHVNEQGEAITNRIRRENQVLASYEIDIFKEPSRFHFQALEPTELIVIDLDEMRQLIERNTQFEAGRRYFLNASLAESLRALDDFILLSPEQRYLKFLQENPGLMNRVPNKYIAHILGITPVSLSRIRKRIAGRKQ